MTYIDLMNSFLDSSEYVHLSPNAQALYVRLFYINNKCGWAKWFGASDRRLMELTCIDSKNSFTRAKKQLQEYGYIEIKTEPKKTTRYHLIDITKKQPTNCPDIGADVGADAGADAGALNRLDKTRLDKTRAAAATVLQKNSNELQEAIRIFSDNIHPLSGEIELDMLTELVDKYHLTWVSEAITEAALNNGRSLKYISAILQRWEKDGFKTKRGTDNGGNGNNQNGRGSVLCRNGRASPRSIADSVDWSQDSDGWD